MRQHEASRTLVKSPPELWAECSDPSSLGRHLRGFFGEIRITKLEPETAVAWEGEEIRGTVRLEPAGWGTRVTLTASSAAAQTTEPDPAPAPAAAVEPADPPPAPPHAGVPGGRARTGPPQGLLTRLWRRVALRPVDPVPNEPAEESPPPEPPPEPPPDLPPAAAGPAEPGSARVAGEPETRSKLTAALESLGQAHHRPFSRS